MARKLRLEFPGAYHIINRGNYRRWIFDTAATRTAFEACLFEACSGQPGKGQVAEIAVSRFAPDWIGYGFQRGILDWRR